jgi:hypothetical protein
VTGFFQYSIEDVYSVNQQNPNVKTLQIFTIPVGQCTGPIAVKKGDPAPFGPDPMVTTATVSMLPRAGAYLESFNVTRPSGKTGPMSGEPLSGRTQPVDDVVIPAPGGGYVDVIYPASTSTESRTVVLSRARSNPARVKICKIAGSGHTDQYVFSVHRHRYRHAQRGTSSVGRLWGRHTYGRRECR